MCLQKLIDNLVYQHLIDKKLFKTAQILKEERIDFYSKKTFEDQRVSETLSEVISRYFQKAKDKHFDITEKSLDHKIEYLYSYDDPEDWKPCRKCSICKKALVQEDMLKTDKAFMKEKKEQNVAVHEGKKAQDKTTKPLGQKVLRIGKLEKSEDYQEFALPFGWRKVGQKRAKSNKWDFLVFNPEGKKFTSNVKVNTYLENNSEITCDQKVRSHPYIMSACFWPLWIQPTHLIGKIQHFLYTHLEYDVIFIENPPSYFVFFFWTF